MYTHDFDRYFPASNFAAPSCQASTLIILKDVKGDVAKLTTSNANQSNGIIQSIDTVLLPN